jgi:ADP-heptose:LPS heptosyltransferase
MDDEVPLVDEVIDQMEEPALKLAGRLDLSALAALLARAAVVVANDTGPLHLAEAVGAATVGIYWCGNVINGASPYRRRHRIAISWQLDCPVCGVDCTRGTCVHRDPWVAGVPVDEVAGHAVDLLRGEASPPPVPTRVVAAAAPG